MAGKRILIIDDDEDIREAAQLCLEGMVDWDTVMAESGQQGIDKARETQPDAILLDVRMPDMDGPAVFEKLRADGATSHIPVILLTGRSGAADREKFTALGVNAVIAKPFTPMTLADQICEALGWPAES